MPDALDSVPFAGRDWSANAPAVIAGTLLLAIPANALRRHVEIQNQSVDPIRVVRDDGFGTQRSVIVLTGALDDGLQGAGWSSSTFLGRIRVYGSAGAQVSAYED